jgi:hypothetical protein
MADQGHVVGDEDDREAERLLQFLDLHHQRPLRHHVERGRGLVHDHQIGGEQHRHRDHRALPHPAGQLVRVASQVHGVDADHPQHLGGPGGDLLGRVLAVRPHRVLELGPDGLDRVQRVHRALHDDRHGLPADRGELPVGQSHQVRALERDGARGHVSGRGQQLGDGEQQRGLPAA